MDMVERVARAICLAHAIDSGYSRGCAEASVDVEWKAWVVEARAAIAAMREPTEEMVDAGWQTSDDVVWMALKEAWPAMIDAALTSSEK